MSQEHTKLPWIIRSQSEGLCIITSQPESKWADTTVVATNLRPGDAELTAKSANCHYAMIKALAPLARIADAYDADQLNELDKSEIEGIATLENIALYYDKDEQSMLNLADCMAARESLCQCGEWPPKVEAKERPVSGVSPEQLENIVATRLAEGWHWKDKDVDGVMFRFLMPPPGHPIRKNFANWVEYKPGVMVPL